MRNATLAVVRWGTLGLVLWTGLGGGAPAGATTLRWKFRPGEKLHYVMELKTVSTMSPPGGKEIKNTLSQTVDLTWDVKSVGEDGAAEMTQTIDRVRQSIESPFLGVSQYDSRDTKELTGPAAASAALYKALIGTPIPFKMNALGELSQVKVPEKLVTAFREAGPNAGPAGALLTEQGLEDMIKKTSLEVPKDDLTEGKTWTKQTKTESPFGIMTFDMTYKDLGRDAKAGGNVERIGLETKIGIQAGDAAAAPTIRAQESKGVYEFDNAAGRLVDMRINERIEMVANVTNVKIPLVTDTTTTRKLVPASGDAAK